MSPAVQLCKLPPGSRLLCPFHDDHTPSAKILPGPRQRFYCFTCGVSEDRIGCALRLLFPDRYHERNKKDLAEAIQWLELGGWRTAKLASDEEEQPVEVNPFTYTLMSRFCELATEHLKIQPSIIREIQESRGVADPVVLRLGIAHWSLLERLKDEYQDDPDWSEEVLIQTGIMSPPRKERPSVYRLSDRLIIPEWRPDPWGRGEVVAFYQARTREEARSKYLNPPIPSQIYGAHSITRKTAFLWVGEGVFDVLPLIEAGAAAIATLGTHLSDLGFDTLNTIVNGRIVLLAFDNDKPSEQDPLDTRAVASSPPPGGRGRSRPGTHPPRAPPVCLLLVRLALHPPLVHVTTCCSSSSSARSRPGAPGGCACACLVVLSVVFTQGVFPYV